MGAILKNREELVDELAVMLKDFDKHAAQYQTDVYLYYNKEEQTAELDTFVNIGGNSWLNDDHYTIYRDKEHYDDGWDCGYFCGDWNVSDFCEILDISPEELLKVMIDKGIYNEDDEMTIDDLDKDRSEVLYFIRKNSEYADKMQQYYEDWIDENYSDYSDRAGEIIDEWINEYDG